MNNVAINCEKLTKRYKNVVAVNGIDLKVYEGELFALLGVNGAGKSTTIKMLSTLTKPTSGDAFVLGNSVISSANKVKELIDVSMQETAIARNLTVLENMQFYCKLYLLSSDETKERIDSLVKEFSLESVLERPAKNLSGGYQRKLSIALALLSKPKVLFLDEPTLGLDVIARRELWKIIESLKGKVTVVLTTHYMEEAEALADRIAIMVDGSIKDCGSTAELLVRHNAKNVEEAFVSAVTKEVNAR